MSETVEQKNRVWLRQHLPNLSRKTYLLPPTRLPADFITDRVPITIIDTSASPWGEVPYKDAAERTTMGNLTLDGLLSGVCSATTVSKVPADFWWLHHSPTCYTMWQQHFLGHLKQLTFLHMSCFYFFHCLVVVKIQCAGTSNIRLPKSPKHRLIMDMFGGSHKMILNESIVIMCL